MNDPTASPPAVAALALDTPGDAPEDLTDRFLTMWHRPPGRLFHALLALTTLATVWVGSELWPDFFVALALLTAWATLGAVWSLRLLTYLVARHRGRADRPPWAFAALVVTAAAVLVVVGGGGAAELRWELDRPAFEAYVADPASRPLPPDAVTWANPLVLRGYVISSVTERDGTWLFEFRDRCFLSTCGLEYRPGPHGTGVGTGTGGSNGPVDPPWYRWMSD